MVMESRNPKLHRGDIEINMPPRWGFSWFVVGGYNYGAPPELKNGSSAPAPIGALIQEQLGRSEGERSSQLNCSALVARLEP